MKFGIQIETVESQVKGIRKSLKKLYMKGAPIQEQICDVIDVVTNNLKTLKDQVKVYKVGESNDK
jgi:hypothetical protein